MSPVFILSRLSIAGLTLLRSTITSVSALAQASKSPPGESALAAKATSARAMSGRKR